MKRIVLSLVLLFVVCLGNLLSQNVISGKGIFQIDADVTSFYGNETQNYVEVAYGIREGILTYKMDGGRFLAAANMRLEVRNDSAVVSRKEWTVPHSIADTSMLSKSQTMTGVESFGLPFGNYTIIIAAYDFYDQRRIDSVQFPVSMREYVKGKEIFSDVELCSSIQSSSNKESMFYKNTLEVIPNPSRLYGIGLPILYYYSEAYNLLSDSNKNALTVHTAIVDASGKEVLSQDKKKPRLLNSSVEVGTMNLTTLRGGTYQFRISLIDSSYGMLAQSSKKFFVYKPQSADMPENSQRISDVTGSEYAMMTEEEVNRELGPLIYLASDHERIQVKQLSELDAKRKFLFEFWKRRDPDPLTPENEFKQEFLKRVTYAHDQFTSNLREGWKTDRGRVYIVYGPYDDIERVSSSDESMPYEKWIYNEVQGGVVFVFVDQRGTGDYLLVHSTHRNEIREDNWYELFAKKAHGFIR